MKNELITHEAMLPKNQNEREKLPDCQGEKINENYQILQKGALKYIGNNEGQIVSKGYHEFKVFKHNDIVAIVGQEGAKYKLLKIPQNLDGFFEESPARFHEIIFDDELGLIIASAGAMSCILDMQTGQEISKNYHSIFKRGGKLYGKTGTHEEEIELFTPKQISETKQIENNNQ